jgi:methylthioribose-1-phosphate isomerase
MGKVGAKLIGDQESIITHCNTGGLATVGIGTALGVIRSAHAQGKKIHVYVDETRPLLQGGRLTTWELEKFEIPYTLICDNMAAALMKQGKVQRALVGADRIALNGDFANKIGTYSLSIAARHHQVPFHPVAPLTTVDFGCPDGMAIPIEERNSEEVVGITQPQKIRWAPAAAKVWNPAFDVTPATMLTSLILDKGILSGAQLQAGELKNFKRFLD